MGISKSFFTALLVCSFSFHALTAEASGTDTKSNGKPTNETKATNSPKSTVAARPTPAPHCEVPCGIYTDQLRFEMMLEDTKTIAKAIASLNEIAEGFSEGPPSAKTINQMTRWIATKEDHATKTQNVIAQYFLTQRIKSDHKDYAKQLAAAHKVMVSAMKCKQDADPKTAGVLKAAIFDLYRAYEGKEPQFNDEKKTGSRSHRHDTHVAQTDIKLRDRDAKKQDDSGHAGDAHEHGKHSHDADDSSAQVHDKKNDSDGHVKRGHAEKKRDADK